MNKEYRQQLLKHFRNDVPKMVKSKKLLGDLLAESISCTYEDHSQLTYTVMVDVLDTPRILKVNVKVEDIDELFDQTAYNIVDEDAKLKKRYDPMTLARLRLLRIFYEAVTHISTGWTDSKGCFHGTLAMATVYAEIRSPGIIFYHN